MSHIIRQVELPLFDEENRGKLVPIDLDSVVPFEVKRSYYLWNVLAGRNRGGHAHTIEKEFFVCIRGRCSIHLSPDGTPPQKTTLYTPQMGIFVDNLVWHEFSDFSPDAMLLCFSSTPYLPDNYIHSFEDFQKMCK